MPDRIWKQEISADAVLVSNGYNMRYLSGFRGTDMIFSFLAIFQVLQCAFLIFHVF